MALNKPLQYDSIEDSIEAFRDGNFIIVLDSPSRENEGDLVIAASAMTPNKMAFMIHHTSGFICTPIMPSLAVELQLPLMVEERDSRDPNKTAYTISSISAHDRAVTCNLLASSASNTSNVPGVKESNASIFRRPGHILPLRAHPNLTRERRGHTEAALEFCRLSGLPMAGVICELVESGVEIGGKAERKESGMMRGEACLKFGKQWGLKCCCIEDLVKWIETRK